MGTHLHSAAVSDGCQPKPGDLVKALELVDHNKTEIYAEGLLLDSEIYCADGLPICEYEYQVVTILARSGLIMKFACETGPHEDMGAMWLVKVYENDVK